MKYDDVFGYDIDLLYRERVSKDTKKCHIISRASILLHTKTGALYSKTPTGIHKTNYKDFGEESKLYNNIPFYLIVDNKYCHSVEEYKAIIDARFIKVCNNIVNGDEFTSIDATNLIHAMVAYSAICSKSYVYEPEYNSILKYRDDLRILRESFKNLKIENAYVHLGTKHTIESPTDYISNLINIRLLNKTELAILSSYAIYKYVRNIYDFRICILENTSNIDFVVPKFPLFGKWTPKNTKCTVIVDVLEGLCMNTIDYIHMPVSSKYTLMIEVKKTSGNKPNLCIQKNLCDKETVDLINRLFYTHSNYVGSTDENYLRNLTKVDVYTLKLNLDELIHKFYNNELLLYDENGNIL